MHRIQTARPGDDRQDVAGHRLSQLLTAALPAAGIIAAATAVLLSVS